MPTSRTSPVAQLRARQLLRCTPLLRSHRAARLPSIKNPGVTKRTKHFERWLHYARDSYLMGRFKISLVSTLKMMGDNMTKPLDRTKFMACRAYQLNE